MIVSESPPLIRDAIAHSFLLLSIQRRKARIPYYIYKSSTNEYIHLVYIYISI